MLVDLPVLGPNDVEDVQKFAAAFGMDFVAASFVQHADDVRWDSLNGAYGKGPTQSTSRGNLLAGNKESTVTYAYMQTPVMQLPITTTASC